MPVDAAQRILVIKLGALGDVVLALGPFAAIRRHHDGARITLLTTMPYKGFLAASGYFDEIWIDDRPPPLRVDRWLALRRHLRGGRFHRVYDLQTSDRTGWYFRLLGPGTRPEWSGIARGCSHPHASAGRKAMHTVERQAEQLSLAGIAAVPAADLSWVAGDAARFRLAPRHALLVPGGASHRPGKRWPVAHYASLARRLAGQGLQPVVLGTAGETPLARTILAACPEARDLTGATSLADIAVLARTAAAAVGNDTGPMHMIAAGGCPAVVLFSAESDPALTAPRGPCVAVVRRDDLGSLPLDEVAGALRLR